MARVVFFTKKVGDEAGFKNLAQDWGRAPILRQVFDLFGQIGQFDHRRRVLVSPR